MTTPRTRTVALVSGGVVVAGALLAGLFQVRLGAPLPAESAVPDDVVDLIPRPPPRGDAAVDALDPQNMTLLPDLEQGGWIEAFDRTTGRLAQRYRFDRLDPDPPQKPPQWAEITKPQAEIYSEADRVLILTADSALVHRPHGLLESGTLSGSVTIRQFELPVGRALDFERDRPTLVVRTARADFDNFLGRIQCAGSFRVETPTAEFLGRGLSILINDRDQQINELSVTDVDFVRFARRAQSEAPRPEAPRPEAPPAVASTDPPSPASPDPARSAAPAVQKPTSNERPTFYRLVFKENVRVEDRIRTLTGETLTIVFSTESEVLGGTMAGASDTGRLASLAYPWHPTTQLAMLVFAVSGEQRLLLAPPPSPDDVYITCSGGPRLVPETDPKEQPASPRDVRLTLRGRPARLVDAERELEALCAAMVYETLERTVRLVGTSVTPLSITSPELEAGGETFFYRETERRGGFTGPGELELLREAGNVHVGWAQGVDLVFGAGEGAQRLKRAVFRGEAVARSVDPPQTVWADRLEATFADEQAIDRFAASGNVQVAMGEEGRVFADTVEGTEGGKRVVVAGENLLVIQGAWLLDEGRRLELDDDAQTLHWAGAGRARLYAEPLIGADEGRVPRPVPQVRPDLVATWQNALTFDGTARDGAGDVELVGEVNVLSERSDLERVTLGADGVTLELLRGERSLERMVASGDAWLESRRWRLADRSDTPGLFYVSGPHLAYTEATGEATVLGAGDLLVRDLRPPDPGLQSSPLLQRGTTTFRFSEGLTVTRRDDGLQDVRMDGDIEMRHRGLGGEKSMLSCRQIRAVLDSGSDAGTEANAQLRALRAEGAVFLRSPQRDVVCEIFDYDVAAGLAELQAPPGGTVTVHARHTPGVLRFERARWDLKGDRITVVRPTGGG